MEVPSGWIQVIRGPRPKAERWPTAKKGVPHVSAAAEVLKAALKRAQVASREAPLAVQVKECESFIERARNRITKLDEERVAEVAELEKAESRLVRLKLQTSLAPPPVDGSSEVQRLQHVVVDLQAKLQEVMKDKPMRDVELSRKRLREDYVQDVTRLAKLVADGGAQLKAWTAEDCVSQRRSDVSDDELALRSGPGEGSICTILSVVRLVAHRCGFRGCRVGEAANPWRIVTRYKMRGQRIGEAKNPGPGSQRRRTQRLRALQRALDSDSESDAPHRKS